MATPDKYQRDTQLATNVFITQTNWENKGAKKIGCVTPPLVTFSDPLGWHHFPWPEKQGRQILWLLQKWILGRSHPSVLSIRPWGRKSKQVSAYPLNNVNSWRATIWWHDIFCKCWMHAINLPISPSLLGVLITHVFARQVILVPLTFGWVNHYSIYSNTKIEMKRICA